MIGIMDDLYFPVFSQRLVVYRYDLYSLVVRRKGRIDSADEEMIKVQ